jgi:hypothetical protein
MGRPSKNSSEVRGRAVRLVQGHLGEYARGCSRTGPGLTRSRLASYVAMMKRITLITAGVVHKVLSVGKC